MEITWRVIRKGKREMREKVQGISSINGKYKIDRGKLRIVYRKWRSQRTYVYDPWTLTKEGNAGGNGGTRKRGIKKRKKWDN